MKRLIALLLLLHLQCMLGGSSTSENTRILGSLVDTSGTPAAAAQVKMIPSGYNPVQDGPLAAELIDTTDAAGRYQFDLPQRGNYVIQAVSLNNGTRMLRKNINAWGDSIHIARDTLRTPGAIKVFLSDTPDTTSGYVFILGTDRFAQITSRIVHLDSVPSGVTPPLYSMNGTTRALLTTATTVPAGDTAIVARVLLVVNAQAGGVPINAGDQILQQKIVEMGLAVSIKDEITFLAIDTVGVDCIVLSPSIDSLGIATRLAPMEKPVICCNTFLLTGLNMTGSISGTDFAAESNTTGASWVIGDSTHPVAGSLTGLVPLFQTTPQLACWGKPVPGTPMIVLLIQYIDRSMVFCCDRLAPLTGSSVAPAKRGAFLVGDEDGGKITAEGWDMMKRMVEWAVE